MTYVALAIPIMAAAMLAAAGIYVFAFELRSRSGAMGLHAIGILVVMLIAIPVGLSVGGFVWAAVGRRFFHFTRSEVEGFVMQGPRIRPIVRYNKWCLTRLFGREGN